MSRTRVTSLIGVRGLLTVDRSGMLSTDAQFLAAIAKADRDAFACLYDRYSAQLFGWLKKVLGGEAAAEEALQDTFLQVWRTARSYDSRLSSPRTWLFLIARSRAYDELRRRKRQPVPTDLPAPGAASAADIGMLAREEAERVRRALASLPDEQRVAIGLAFYGGQTYDSVARILEIPLGTVKTRIRLGMTTLRNLLDDARPTL
jgi:RNA polymerase sigma-70 factor (ECF subfamily)